MRLPKITFRAMNFEDNTDVMSGFIFSEIGNNNTSNTDYFKNVFRGLEEVDFNDMSRCEINKLLQIKIKDEWLQYMSGFELKVSDIQNQWNKINDDVMVDLSKRLDIKWPDDLVEIEARIGIVYACPRYINERVFDVNIMSEIDKMIEISLHEICHFLYFEKWKSLFNDNDCEHYESPHIIWYLSEAMIDPLLNNNIFNKYTKSEICSYQMFYEVMIGNVSLIEIMRGIVEEHSISEAIEKCYKLFLDNEKLIKEY